MATDESEPEGAKTMVLQPVEGTDSSDVSEESTVLLDVEQLRKGRCGDVSGPVDESSSPPEVGGGVEVVGRGHLEQVADGRRGFLGEILELIPPDDEFEETTALVARRLEELTGCDHGVRWLGVDTASTAGGSPDFVDGVWTWGRMPPAHDRLVVGIQRRLADAWCRQLDGGQKPVGDDFEYGVVSFLIAEFCEAFCADLDWPTWVWGVNPIARGDLEQMLIARSPLVAELAFEVDVGSTRGVVQMLLPVAVVRALGEESKRHREIGDPQTARWGALRVVRPLVVGSVQLRHPEFQRLRRGDVVLLRRHGVHLEGVAETAVDHAARWLYGEGRQICGRLVEIAAGRWGFEVLRHGSNRRQTEENVSETTTDQSDHTEGDPLNPDVESATMNLEVRIGKVSMELAELAALRRGQILDCQRPVSGPVELVVDGARVGRGELVCVDGRLGVRVLSVVR